MKLVINAWLERRHPQLSVIDADTGHLLVTWREDQLHSMLEQGYLNMEDINDASLPIGERLGMDSTDYFPDINWAARVLGFMSAIEGTEHV